MEYGVIHNEVCDVIGGDKRCFFGDVGICCIPHFDVTEY